MRWSLITMLKSIRSHELLFLIILLNLLLCSSCARTTPLSSPEVHFLYIFSYSEVFFMQYLVFFINSDEVLTCCKGMLMEDKIRLGSIPPSCHNRCNACNPCTAIQVPTLPSQGDQLLRASSKEMPFSMYSNYKPLGWKCRCRDQLFNP